MSTVHALVLSDAYTAYTPYSPILFLADWGSPQLGWLTTFTNNWLSYPVQAAGMLTQCSLSPLTQQPFQYGSHRVRWEEIHNATPFLVRVTPASASGTVQTIAYYMYKP